MIAGRLFFHIESRQSSRIKDKNAKTLFFSLFLILSLLQQQCKAHNNIVQKAERKKNLWNNSAVHSFRSGQNKKVHTTENSGDCVVSCSQTKG